jgi:peptide methionine sulfoxide reductase MsrA
MTVSYGLGSAIPAAMCAMRLTAISTHAEAIEIIFDPVKLSYRQILEFFF